MKKTIITICIMLLAGLGIVGNASAAGKGELYFDPIAKEVKVGDSFNLNIKVRLNGEKVDTVRAIVNYPPDLLEASYFSLNGTFSTSAPGNYIDNKKGVISQGGAIMGGEAREDSQFGTITFKAKKNGEAKISFNSQSKMIATGQEKINIGALAEATIKIGDSATAEETVSEILITSVTHPDQEKWYNGTEIDLKWEAVDKNKEISAYYIGLSKNPEDEPGEKIIKEETSKKYFEPIDGIWYFSVKAQYKDNKFSNIARYKLMVDRTDPMKILPIIEQPTVNEGDPIEVKFATMDQQSGIEYYEVGIDGENFSRQESPYLIRGLSAGEHVVTVRAIDKAGNLIANAIPVSVVAPVVTETPATPIWKYVVIVLGFVLMVVVLIKLKKTKNSP